MVGKRNQTSVAAIAVITHFMVNFSLKGEADLEAGGSKQGCLLYGGEGARAARPAPWSRRHFFGVSGSSLKSPL